MIEAIRSKLKSAYDTFVQLYGNLNKSRNRITILKDDMGFVILASLERKGEGSKEWISSDILTRSNDEPMSIPVTEDPIEALSYSLGIYGKVDTDVICSIVNKEWKECVNEIGDLIYYNPIVGEWENASRFLSGNVYVKLLQCENAYTENQDQKIAYQLERSTAALKEVQPQQIPWELLQDSFNCGERWIHTDYYKRFAIWLFDCAMTVKYFPSTDVFKVSQDDYGSSAKINKEYYVRSLGGTSLYGYDLMEHALMDTRPDFQYTTYVDGRKTTRPDNDAIQLANEKIESIRSQFTIWLNTLPEEDRQYLVDTYNHMYNCYVLRSYDGSHMRLPDLDLSKLGRDESPITLYAGQKNAIWRIVQDTGAIIDWEVGSGKSLICIIASYEMRRMGIRRKPCILALKANVSDIATTYRKAYPTAKILAPSEKDFEKQNRKRLFHNIKNNDWDCVIMTHDQFGKIPQSAKIQQEILQEEIDNLERDLDSLRSVGYNISRHMKKGLEHRKQTLTVKLRQIQARIDKAKDDDIDFESMGIDHLFIDEAHKYKNLTYTTRHDRVAGLGNPIGSNRALDMLFAIRTLQNRFNADLQCTFLSGTPISNSLTEMYLLFKYLRPRELARQNILNFDAWAAVFAKKTTDFEFSVTNQIIAKERFRHFIKVPELSMFYREIADYQTNKSVKIDKPEMNESLVPLPATPDQKEFIQNLIKFAETGDGSYIGRDDLTPEEDRARMLIATNYAKKMSTDMRLIDHVRYDDHPGNKLSVCCQKVAECYRGFMEHKGTQIIFCDLGVPDKKNKKPWDVYTAIRSKLVEEYEIPVEEIAFIHDYDERSRPTLFRKINNGDVRVLIASTDKGGTGVNVQQRIVTIHDLDIPWKPAELEQRGGRGARQGNWIAKLYQDNTVFRYIYAVEQSLDTYKFTLLKNKQTFISQMKTNGLNVRSIDEGSFDESTGMNFAEYVAVLSGDNSLLEKAKIDKKLAVLENLRAAHYRQQQQNKYDLEHKTNRLVLVDEMVISVQRDYDLYSSLVTINEEGIKDNPIDIPLLRDKLRLLSIERDAIELSVEIEHQERSFMKSLGLKPGRVVKRAEPAKDDAVYIGEYLISLFNAYRPSIDGAPDCIGSLYGFNLYIVRETNQDSETSSRRTYTGDGQNIMYYNKYYVQHPAGGLKYLHNHGIPSRESPRLASKLFISSLERILGILNQYKDEQHRLNRSLLELQQVEYKEFSKESEIAELKAETKRLEKEILDRIQGRTNNGKGTGKQGTEDGKTEAQKAKESKANGGANWDDEEEDNDATIDDILSDEWFDEENEGAEDVPMPTETIWKRRCHY